MESINTRRKYTPEEVKTDQAIEKCIKYSEKPEELRALLGELSVSVELDGIKKYFSEDTTPRLCGKITIERKPRRPAVFSFGFSINDTEAFQPPKGHNWDEQRKNSRINAKKREEFQHDLLYTVLACCASDYYCPKSFVDFCGEYGYSTDSIKARDTHRACLEQSAKLENIFRPAEVEALPR